ncbi:MAG: hypothetical protein ABIA04_12995 [Pseudomonadota bacterium]
MRELSGIWKYNKNIIKNNDLYLFNQNRVDRCIEKLSLNSNDTFVQLGIVDGEIIYSASQKVKKAYSYENDSDAISWAKIKIAGLNNAEIINENPLECNLRKLTVNKAYSYATISRLDKAGKVEFFKKIAKHFSQYALLLIEDFILNDETSDTFTYNKSTICAQASEYYGAFWEYIKEDFLSKLETGHPASLSDWKAALSEGGFWVTNHWQMSSFFGGIVAMKA